MFLLTTFGGGHNFACLLSFHKFIYVNICISAKDENLHITCLHHSREILAAVLWFLNKSTFHKFPSFRKPASDFICMWIVGCVVEQLVGIILGQQLVDTVAVVIKKIAVRILNVQSGTYIDICTIWIVSKLIKILLRWNLNCGRPSRRKLRIWKTNIRI